MKIKNIGNKMLKATAIAIAIPSYCVGKAVKAATYGMTKNETARGIADILELGGDIYMMGAQGVGNEN